jgi:phosphoribosylanthranilate isomerase
VRYIGVNGWPKSPRYVAPGKHREILQEIPAGARVFVDVESDLSAIEQALEAGFDFVHIHFDPNRAAGASANAAAQERVRVDAWARLVGRERLWLAPRHAPGTAWPEWVPELADTVLFDGYKPGAFGGTGSVADLSHFTSLRKQFPQTRWVLAGGLSPDTLPFVRDSGADIFDLNSGVEVSPGIKSAAKISLALAALHAPARSHRPEVA